jgi:hypothetical protein
MTKFKPVYPELESKILITMYENPELDFDTFQLIQWIDQTNAGSSEFPGKFKAMVKATEQLIVKGLVDGKGVKHHDLGVYFTEMKFKFKGKQEAIRVRDEADEFKKQLPKMIEESSKVVAEMNEFEKKQKK